MNYESPFPLEQALLGFLMQEPAHGYALHQRAEEELGRIWYMGISNVYRTLKDLEETGEVESYRDEASYPPRKVYTITQAGRQRFLTWIREPVAAVRDQRVELLAKVYFFYTLKLEGLEPLLEAQEALCRERLHQIGRRAALEPQDAFGRAVSEFRRLRIQATIDWLRKLEQE